MSGIAKRASKTVSTLSQASIEAMLQNPEHFPDVIRALQTTESRGKLNELGLALVDPTAVANLMDRLAGLKQTYNASATTDSWNAFMVTVRKVMAKFKAKNIAPPINGLKELVYETLKNTGGQYGYDAKEHRNRRQNCLFVPTQDFSMPYKNNPCHMYFGNETVTTYAVELFQAMDFTEMTDDGEAISKTYKMIYAPKSSDASKTPMVIGIWVIYNASTKGAADEDVESGAESD